MSYSVLLEFFIWSSIINIAILMFWAFMFATSNQWIYELHSNWFEMSKKQFDITHYRAMAFFKLVIFIFNLTPLLVLWGMKGF